QALARLDQALEEMIVLGVNTNLEYLQHLLRDPDVVSGAMDTTLVEARLPQMQFDTPDERHAHMAAMFIHQRQQTATSAWGLDGFRMHEVAPITYLVDYPAEEPLRHEVTLDLGADLSLAGPTNQYVYRDETWIEVVTIVAEDR